jgi:hypothetical protein
MQSCSLLNQAAQTGTTAVKGLKEDYPLRISEVAEENI